LSRGPGPAIRVSVDPANPGQFFACCGLLELADRLWGGAEGWFDGETFAIQVQGDGSLSALLMAFKNSSLVGDGDGDGQDATDDQEDAKAKPMEIAFPGQGTRLSLDWWAEKSLKSWAGSMNAQLIFHAMKGAIDERCPEPFHDLRMVSDPVRHPKPIQGEKKRKKKGKKREPFYFDARRGAKAHPVDVGFSPNAITEITCVACPAVESLCLVGLQRHRPKPTSRPRVFEYHTWSSPLCLEVTPVAVIGLLAHVGHRGYRFENAFRTDQRKHKGFIQATPLERKGL